MRRKLQFSLAVTAALAVQALNSQAAMAASLFCSQTADAACSNYGMFGFASYYDCATTHPDFCAVEAAGEGCYYDPREGGAQICV